jgi:hypothetical protein
MGANRRRYAHRRGEDRARTAPAKWRVSAVAAAAVAAIAAAFLILEPWADVDGPPYRLLGRAARITSSQPSSSPGSLPPSSPAGVPGEPIMVVGSTNPIGAVSLWSDVVFPVVPSTGRSIARAGSVIVEAGVQGSPRGGR